MLCPAALTVAEEIGVPRYVFYTSSLMSLASLLHAPELARTTTGKCRDLPEPVRLPGCITLRGADLVDPLQDRANPVYALIVDLGLDYLRADGFIVNTFDDLEHDTLVSFQDLCDKDVYPPAYAVGPFVRSCSDEAAKHRCMEWLDGQPDGSVLYMCFGSGGALSSRQMAELAAGLEASGQRFLWVVRLPSDKDSSAGYFGTASHGDDPLSYLPEGFAERTGGRGLALAQSAPQVEILNHRAVGGFLSHCGWNSWLEAVAAGVPILAWPLFAEQRINTVKLSSEGAGVALRLRAREDTGDGMVPREEVAAAARELMAGENGAVARKKAHELRVGAEKAAAADRPARRALAAVVDTWNGGSARAAS
jgi:hydroquinone glucosyltransferase